MEIKGEEQEQPSYVDFFVLEDSTIYAYSRYSIKHTSRIKGFKGCGKLIPYFGFMENKMDTYSINYQGIKEASINIKANKRS